MPPRRLSLTRSWIGTALAAALLATMADRPASAQQTFDPYQPYNSMYRPFVYPTNPGLATPIPNQARLPRVGDMSLSQRDLGAYAGMTTIDDPFGIGPAPARGGRFDRAVVEGGDDFDNSQLDRIYIPNRGDQFYADQARRERAFFQALRLDPRARAAELRRLEEERVKSLRARPSSTPRTSDRPSSRADGARTDRVATPAPVDARPRIILRNRRPLTTPRGSNPGAATAAARPSMSPLAPRGAGVGLLHPPPASSRSPLPSDILRDAEVDATPLGDDLATPLEERNDSVSPLRVPPPSVPLPSVPRPRPPEDIDPEGR